MKPRSIGMSLVALAATQSSVSALTPASKSDGPIRLLSCVVSGNGKLEAEVDNQTDDAQFCNIRCNYAIAGQTFTHWFDVTIPKRFSGRVGEFDTNGAKAGSYPGDVGTCKKTATH